MNPLDWLLAILLTYSVVKAAVNGFFRESLSLAGLVVGFLLAGWYYRTLARNLAGLISNPAFAQFAAFLLILAAVMILAALVARLLRRTASTIGLGFMDRLGGALFGFLRGALLGTALLMAFTAFLPGGVWLQTSRLAPYFLQTAHAVSFVMPSDLRTRLRDGLGHLKHTAPDWIKPGRSSHTG
jgi:membrane protein required for colicin V production